MVLRALADQLLSRRASCSGSGLRGSAWALCRAGREGEQAQGPHSPESFGGKAALIGVLGGCWGIGMSLVAA